MSESINPTDSRTLDLDEIVERFENAWHKAGEARVEEFLPPSDHPQFDEIAVELLCIDFERRAKSDRSKSVEEYRIDFPDLLKRNSILEGLAFEEYRLLSSADTRLDPSVFARKYGIRTQHWPRASAGRDTTDAIAHSAMTGGVADEMGRIASVPQLPKIGEPFLNFDLVAELGKCQFGRVFLAKQRDLSNRQVVIKVTSNLWLESDRLARLQHTNIVPVYSVHEHNGLQAVCMPYLGKQTLASIFETYHQQTESPQRQVIEIWSSYQQDSQQDRSRLRRQEYLRGLTHEQLCAWIIAKVAAGLSHAHDRGILHRDLKPANILMTDDLQPMILDFNLSEDAVAGGRSSLLIGGTLPYMAPEHLMAVISEGDVDERSDLYSMGVMLFQLLTGRLPFAKPPGSTIGALSYLLNDRTDVAPAVRTYDPQLSTDIESIVMRCLAAKPADRYQTARELHDDLERHLMSLSPMHAPIRSRKEQLSKWLKRHPRATSSIVIVTVSCFLVAMLTFFYVARTREARLVARQSFQQFKLKERSASGPLSIPAPDKPTAELGLRNAKSALEMFGANQHRWIEQPGYRLLSETEQTELRRLVRRLQYLVADAHLRKSASDSATECERLLRLALRHNKLAIACDEPPVAAALRLQQDAINAALGITRESYRGEISEIPRLELDTSSGLLLAMHHIRNKKFADAESILLKLNHDRPRDSFIWLVLGNCRYALKRPLQAESCFTSSITIWPESPTAYFLRGVCRMELKILDEAEDDFTRAIALAGENKAALANRALVRIERKKYHEAISDLTRLIENGRDDSLIYLLRADAHSGLGNTKLAELDVEMGKRKTPVCADGWIQRGMAFYPSSPETALQDFNAALEIDADSKRALKNKVAVLSQLDRNQEAVEAASKLVDQSPKDATVLLGRGLLHSRLGDREAALADCELALELTNSPSNHYQTARILANTSREFPSDADRAAFHLRKALQGHPQIMSSILRDPDMKLIVKHPKIQSLLATCSKLFAEAD